MATGRVQEVLNFWFGVPGSANYLKSKSFWYGSKEDDKLVRRKLGQDYEDARKGILDEWSNDVEGGLALIILLDQVPRNIFRDKAQAYETDPKALTVSKKIVANGWDQGQPTIIRRYIYSPFNHSENFADQEQSVKLFAQLGDPMHMFWAQRHYDIIKEHGRFPHRDFVMKRK